MVECFLNPQGQRQHVYCLLQFRGDDGLFNSELIVTPTAYDSKTNMAPSSFITDEQKKDYDFFNEDR